MKQKLPRTFKIGGKQFRVAPNIPLPPRVRGRVFPMTGVIQLSPKHSDDPAIFWHEVTHAILHDMGQAWRGEAFVEGFSKRLTECIMTARF